MRKDRNPFIEDIMREKNMKEKYQNRKNGDSTIAQFQFKHCRYCKNKHTDFCEIRQDIDGKFGCVYEEGLYERRNIK